MLQNRWINFVYVFKEEVSSTMVIGTAKEEMGWSFNLLVLTTNWIYWILKIVPKFMISQIAQSKSNQKLNNWLSSGLINFSITLLETLQEVKARMLTSILFHSIINAWKKEFLKKFVFVLKKRTWLFRTLLLV